MNSVFITGGTSGIGYELAKMYLSQGWKVGVCGRDKKKFAENFKQDYQNLYYYEVDVADREALKKAIHEFSKPTGLSILIASAGISYPQKTKIPDFERTYKMVHVNLLGVMYAFEAAMEIMIPQGTGHLVAISSLAGYNGFPGISGYSATKSAVMKFCESLSLDLAHLKINVTCVCPGFVDTPLTQQNNHPMPFLVKADKAAKIIVKGIKKNKRVINFPFIFSCLVKLLSIMPRWMYQKLMSRNSFNYSRKEIKS